MCESRVVTAHGIFNSNNTTQGEINMTAYTVRDAKIEDAQRILEIYAYYVENTAITFEYDVPSKEEFKQRMRKTMQKYPYLVIEKEGRVYGYAYAGPFKERAAYD